MSKFAVRMTSNLKVSYWTLFWPKYWAEDAAGARTRSRKHAALVKTRWEGMYRRTTHSGVGACHVVHTECDAAVSHLTWEVSCCTQRTHLFRRSFPIRWNLPCLP